MNKYLSTFNLGVLLACALQTLPERHYVTGHGNNARRYSGNLPPDNTNGEKWTECKTLAAAKSAMTRRANATTKTA